MASRQGGAVVSQPKRKAPLAMAMLYGANPELAKDQEIARLKAENERIRKAGNAMLITAIEDSTGIWLLPAFKKWIEATEPTASDIGDIAFQTLKNKGVQL